MAVKWVGGWRFIIRRPGHLIKPESKSAARPGRRWDPDDNGDQGLLPLVPSSHFLSPSPSLSAVSTSLAT